MPSIFRPFKAPWFFLLLGLAAAGYGAASGKLSLTGRALSSLSGDTCEGRKFCAVVYLAPWCPHCVSSVPRTKEMIQRFRSPELGVKVIVGLGKSPEQNQKFADSIAPGVVIDSDTSLARKYGVRSVPSYTVLDQEGSAILSGQEAYSWLHEKMGN